MSNYVVEDLVLYRHFMLIDSPIPFDLIANPTNLSRDAQGVIDNSDKSLVTGRDVCSRPAGAWRVDCWTLLPEKYHKLNPVFTMVIKYDADLLHKGEKVDIRYSDIDIGEGVAGINGQLVNISPSDLRPVINAVFDNGDSTRSKLDSLNSAVASVKTAVDSVKTVVDSVKLGFFDRIVTTDVIETQVGRYHPIFPLYYYYFPLGVPKIMCVVDVLHSGDGNCELRGFDVSDKSIVNIPHFSAWVSIQSLWTFSRG